MTVKIKAPKKRKAPRRAAAHAAGSHAADPNACLEAAAGAAAAARETAPSLPADPVPAADPDPPAVPAASPTVRLESSLQIKDVEEAHRRLVAAFGAGPTCTVDLGRVDTIDTAGIQLLLAIPAEAARTGTACEFQGESAAITRALTALGLNGALPIAHRRE